MVIIDNDTATLATATGPMLTHVFRPAAAGRYPGILLYSEIFQMTGPIRRTCAWLAGQGYVVAAPEVYHELEPAGTVLGYTPDGSARGNAHKTAKTMAAYDSDAAAVVDYLAAHPAGNGMVGAMGMCLGGHLAFRAAVTQPRVRASACFYPTDLHKRSLGSGGHDDSLDRVKDIAGELLLVFGRQDPHIPREGREAIHAALEDAGTEFTWHEFNAAHAFLRDEGNRYNPQLARLGLELALDLFRRRLA
jgi:carboxymethylenebutenolidase